jgi:ABC-type branched-subunit amino acid transport system substrate-binding protein
MTQLIGQHAVAVIDEDEQGAPGGYQIAEQSGVPVIGNYSLPVQFQNPDLYPVAPYYQGALGKVMLQIMHNEGVSKLSLMTINVPSAVNAEKIDAADASQFGLTIVQNDLYPPTTTDFTAYVSKAVSKGAQAVFVIGTIGNGTVVSKALQQQGSNAKVVYTEYQNSIASQVGSWGNGKVFSTTPLETLPASPEVAAALKQYGFSSVDPTASAVAEGWTDAQIAAQGVKLLGSNTPTAASMVTALNSISNFKGTYTPPLTYGSGAHADPSHCIQVQEMENGVLGLYKGQPYECFTGSVAPS